MEIDVSNEHPTEKLNTDWLVRIVEAAMPDCLAAAGLHPKRMVLGELEDLSLALVDDETIADLHVKFMGIPGATDVITFDHGEIVISLDTARRYAEEFDSTFEEEVARYAVHGLLHLNGHEDSDPEERAAMHREQEEVLESALAECPPNNAES